MSWYRETERLQLRSLMESDLQNLCEYCPIAMNENLSKDAIERREPF